MTNKTYTKKLIMLEFNDRSKRAIDYYEDIYSAVCEASTNLKAKFDIDIYLLAINGKVVLRMLIPADIVDGFEYGAHLRGIAYFMLKEYPERYRPMQVSRRFLNYIEIPDMAEANEGNAKVVSQFTVLLNRTDPDAKRAKTKIIDILRELEYKDNVIGRPKERLGVRY